MQRDRLQPKRDNGGMINVCHYLCPLKTRAFPENESNFSALMSRRKLRKHLRFPKREKTGTIGNGGSYYRRNAKRGMCVVNRIWGCARFIRFELNMFSAGEFFLCVSAEKCVVGEIEIRQRVKNEDGVFSGKSVGGFEDDISVSMKLNI